MPRPGDIVTTVVTRGAPNYLLADGAPLSIRRTRGGDAWEVRQAAVRAGTAQAGPVQPGQPAAGPGQAATSERVLLGMPASRPAG